MDDLLTHSPGTLALLRNRLDEAVDLLTPPARAGDLQAMEDLAEAAYRRDDFAESAHWHRRLAQATGAPGHDLAARRLGLFRGRVPYRMERAGTAVVPFESTDPLPVITVRLNGRESAAFFLDTGGHEVYVDRALAEKAGAQVAGAVERGYAGGRRAMEGQGRLESFAMGELEVRDVPIRTLDFAGTVIGGHTVLGAVGSAILHRHLTTIDYPAGRLVLRDRSRTLAGGHPFWLAGTHYALTWGTLNRAHRLLLFIDTGGTGVGLVPSPEVIARAGIKLGDDLVEGGRDGGGAVRAVPFTVEELTVNGTTGRDLPGVHFPDAPDFFPEVSRRFPLGGAVSHAFFRPYALTLDFTAMRLELG
ncbi:aspartyl protease family protein [Nonomuraea typhae]|uniref:Aspartyl protease family protein n=1 Tax=Nonomuraea typhae TaxID=2603600 RepID=A0ABW7YKV2_9ACTN